MTSENPPVSMADEVVKRVTEALRPEFEQVRGEIRAAKRDLGADIDANNARLTALTATVDGHAARFRDINEKLDRLSDQMRIVIDRLDRAHIPAE